MKAARVPCLRITRRQKTEYRMSYGGSASLLHVEHPINLAKSVSLFRTTIHTEPRVVRQPRPGQRVRKSVLDKFLFALFHGKTSCSTLKASKRRCRAPPLPTVRSQRRIVDNGQNKPRQYLFVRGRCIVIILFDDYTMTRLRITFDRSILEISHSNLDVLRGEDSRRRCTCKGTLGRSVRIVDVTPSRN